MNSSLRSDANTIIERSIQAVLPDEAVRRALSGRAFSGRVLLVAAETRSLPWPLPMMAARLPLFASRWIFIRSR